MKYKAWVMFDNHTFRCCESETIDGLRKKIWDCYEETYVWEDGHSCKGDQFVAGWGSVHTDMFSSDELKLFGGLLHRKDLPKLTMRGYRDELNKAIAEHNEKISEAQAWIDRLKAIRVDAAL